ncbi:MAG: ATP-binding protein [Bryobacteraceae bacterium]
MEIPDEKGAAKPILPESRDISELRLALEALRESEAKFRTLFDLVPYSMAIHDPDGRLLDGNARFYVVCGSNRERIAGRFISDFFDIHHTGNREEDAALDLKLLQKTQQNPVEVTVIHRASGRRGIVLLSSASVVLEGQPGFLTCALEITELRELERQFRQAQKMEAVGRLAGGVAHDFNNLLTVIRGYTELALEQLPKEDLLYLPLVEVSKAAVQAEVLTRQLLAFSRNQAIEPAVIDLNGLIRDTEKMLQRLIGEDVELGISLLAELPPVWINPGQIVQVLMNLAVNARDAMPAGGRLAIETALVEVGEQRAQAWKLNPGPYVCLRVGDTGAGMDEETQSHIFEPFFTTKPEGQGTGLGLSMVYGIVKQSGGSITVSSRPSAGSVFEILLPAAEPVELSPERQATPEVRAGRETVLLAEDDEALRALTRQILEGAGYLLLQAANGMQALALAQSHDGPIDLLVTDLTMPGINGQELARRLRQGRPGLAVLYMSGYIAGGVLEEALADGSAALIRKPFSPSLLLKHARWALEHRRSMGQ